MKKNTLRKMLSFLVFVSAFAVNAQQSKTLKKGSGLNAQNQTIQLTEANRKALELTGYVRCLTVENEQLLQNQNSNRASKIEFEAWLAPKIAKIKADRAAGKSQMAVFNIPVVIHVIHDGDAVNTVGNIFGENISDTQAMSQIQVMNEDYRRLVGTPGGANSTGAAVDVEINFCLAQQDAMGNPTTGIVRHNITPYSNLHTPGDTGDWELNADVQTLKANTQWNPDLFMNMWSIRPGGNALDHATDPGLTGLLGYAQFPSASTLGGVNTNGGATDTDGVVAGFDVFGTIAEDDGSFIMNGTYNLGRTMTHEVGHWLGLRHIWGDTASCNGGSNAGDYCADTPDSTAPNYTCVTVDNCPTDGLGNDQVENYMDYTADACMDTFTQNQKDRVQVVMQNALRRVGLNSSDRCNAAAPYIKFGSATQLINESTDCGYTDVMVTLEIGLGASANADVTITTSGTATSTEDYEIIGGNISFATGITANQIFTVRVFNDGFVEGDETIVLGMILNANGGDALITTIGAAEQTITVSDDDVLPSAFVAINVYDEDFEGGSGWGGYDRDGDGNGWAMGVAGYETFGNITGDTGASESNGTIFGTGGAYTPDQYLVSEVFTIPAGVTSASVSYVVGSFNTSGLFQEHYSVYFTTIAAPLAYADIEEYVLENDRTVPATGTEIRTHDLTAYVGLTGQLVMRHHNTIGIDGLLLWDTVNVDAIGGTLIQTAVNTGTLDQVSLAGAGTVYTSDSVSSSVMIDITNNNSDDYGCVDVSVSRDGTGAQSYNGGTSPNLVMDKTFTVSPSLANATGSATVKFYFTEAEIAGWETVTGDVRANLVILKNNGTPEVSSAVTIGAFGTDVTLEATFSTGISGTYYFGAAGSLSVDYNTFTTFSLFPNPTAGIINLSLSTSEDVNISLFDIRGRQVYKEVFNNDATPFIQSLDFGKMATGVYMMNIVSGTKNETRKLVIK